MIPFDVYIQQTEALQDGCRVGKAGVLRLAQSEFVGRRQDPGHSQPRLEGRPRAQGIPQADAGGLKG